MINIKETLLQKYHNNKLAHFYILKAPPTQKDSTLFLKEWINDFLCEVICQSKGISDRQQAENMLKMGQADILLIEQAEDPSKEYTTADFSEFFRFQCFTPTELKQRFIIIHNSHKIGKLISNKLLKTLEEPGKQSTIFFINPVNKNFLPTIKSRAISITVSDGNTTDPNMLGPANIHPNLLEWVQNNLSDDPDSERYLPADISSSFIEYLNNPKEPAALIEQLKNNRLAEEQLFKIILAFESSNISSFHDKSQIFEQIKWFQDASIYRNPPQERLFALLKACNSSLQN